MHPAEQDRSRQWRGLGFRLSALALTLVTLTTATGFLLRQPELQPAQPETPKVIDSTQPLTTADETAKPKLFHNWPQDKQPELAIVLSGQMYGHIQPCGCSRPQLGGLERRYNFIESLKTRGWPVVGFDLGDLPNKKGLHKQSLMKYTLAMRALEKMNYSAVGIGQQEFGMPLIEALGSYTLQRGENPPFVLGGNLFNRAENFPSGGNKPLVGSWEIVTGKHPTIGVVGLIGPTLARTVQQNINPQQQFENNKTVITDALKQMDAAPKKPEVLVLLYAGTKEEAILALKAFPQFQVVLCQTAEEEPPAFPTYVDGPEGEPKRMIVNVGHKGRHVGVVGLFRADGKIDLKYHLVSLGEEFETPEEKIEANPVLKLFDQYSETLKEGNFLKQYPKSPHPVQVQNKEATYVGSNTCAACHPAEYQVWDKSKHAQAYKALQVIATKPKNRNYDGECIICHTVGFAYQGGYVDEKSTPNLKGVGCENCHGPGSLHMTNPLEKKFHTGLSPWKINPADHMPSIAKIEGGEALTAQEKLTLNRVDSECQKCHDPDNDPHFRIEDKKYWPQIVHTGLKKK